MASIAWRPGPDPVTARENGLEHHDPPPELNWGLTPSCYAPSLLWVLQFRDSHHPHTSAAEGLEITHLKGKRHWEGPPDFPESLAKGHCPRTYSLLWATLIFTHWGNYRTIYSWGRGWISSEWSLGNDLGVTTNRCPLQGNLGLTRWRASWKGKPSMSPWEPAACPNQTMHHHHYRQLSDTPQDSVFPLCPPNTAEHKDEDCLSYITRVNPCLCPLGLQVQCLVKTYILGQR